MGTDGSPDGQAALALTLPGNTQLPGGRVTRRQNPCKENGGPFKASAVSVSHSLSKGDVREEMWCFGQRCLRGKQEGQDFRVHLPDPF